MPQKRLKPKALKKGARIGITAPARTPQPEWLEKGRAALESEGFSVVIHPHCYEKDYQLAGSDKRRGEALNALFADPSIDAILCPRGGIGSYRIVPYLDFNVIRANPKIFCGFSDITTLLNVIHNRTGLVTFHGPMLLNFFGAHEAYNLSFLSQFLRGEVTGTIPFPTAHCLRKGMGEGHLVGGNITLLQHLTGTPDVPDTKDAILFIEDDEGEKLCDVDRALWHLKNCGFFENIAGLIVGEFTGFREDPFGPWGRDVETMLRELIPPHIPIATHFPCGHGRMMTTLPLGIKTRLETTEKGTFLTYLESPFA